MARFCMLATPSAASSSAAFVNFVIVSVLGVSLGLVVYFFTQERERRDAVQMHFAIELLAIVITAFTSFLAIATGAVTQQLNEAAGNLGIITFSLVGPAAVWAGARAVLNWVKPISVNALEASDVNERISLAEKRLGWIDYVTWKLRVGRFGDAIDAMEMHVIDDLLPKVFYHGSSDVRRLAEAQIRTLFVYKAGHIMKLQRIQGVYDGHGDRPQVYLAATSSTANGTRNSIHAFQERGVVTEINFHENGDWAPTRSDNIDCLVCTIYEEDDIEIGDYLYIDTTKYVDSDPYAYAELMILSDVKCRNLEYWEMQASTLSGMQPVPLIFKNCPSAGDEGATAIKLATSSFADWIAMLATWKANNSAKGNENLNEYVSKLLQLLGLLDNHSDYEAAWKNVVDKGFTSQHSYWNKTQQTVLLATFEWDHFGVTSSGNVD